MKEIRPIKRCIELQPLSREHHDGLLFVWKIRQGISNHTEVEKIRDYIGWYWKNHIRPHFFQEEKVLIPYLPDDPLIERMKKDHAYIRELIIAIDKETNQHDMIVLADLIEQHIRFEERELFEYIQDQLTASELAAIHAQFERNPVVCDEWTEDFWTRKKTG